MAIIFVDITSINLLADQTNNLPSNMNVNINNELVPLEIPLLLQSDSPKLPELSEPPDSLATKRITVKKPTNNNYLDPSIDANEISTDEISSDKISSDEIISGETQLGNELRKILARKPEITTEKLHNPKPKQTPNNQTQNYRNNNSEPQNTNATIVLAQSNLDPLANRPDPPQGRSPDLTAIPQELLNDPKVTNTNQTQQQNNSNNSNNTNHNRLPETPDEQINVAKNHHATTPTFNNNDLTPAVNGWLLIATIVSVAALVYVAVIAVDYHQRWMQTLTAQNDRYFTTGDLNYNNRLNDQFDAAEKNHFGSDFFKLFLL
ncbi:MAG: hypothetical protein LBP59_01875 [Planctomycetaceae bacterium]|nr:hypothetical protein [Planctomycetaceae bacterium]